MGVAAVMAAKEIALACFGDKTALALDRYSTDILCTTTLYFLGASWQSIVFVHYAASDVFIVSCGVPDNIRVTLCYGVEPPGIAVGRGLGWCYLPSIVSSVMSYTV